MVGRIDSRKGMVVNKGGDGEGGGKVLPLGDGGRTEREVRAVLRVWSKCKEQRLEEAVDVVFN